MTKTHRTKDTRSTLVMSARFHTQTHTGAVNASERELCLSWWTVVVKTKSPDPGDSLI